MPRTKVVPTDLISPLTPTEEQKRENTQEPPSYSICPGPKAKNNTHHWVIKEAIAPVSQCSCMFCGEEREFKNFIADEEWGDVRKVRPRRREDASESQLPDELQEENFSWKGGDRISLLNAEEVEDRDEGYE